MINEEELPDKVDSYRFWTGLFTSRVWVEIGDFQLIPIARKDILERYNIVVPEDLAEQDRKAIEKKEREEREEREAKKKNNEYDEDEEDDDDDDDEEGISIENYEDVF